MTVYDSTAKTSMQTWQYGLPHDPAILGTFDGTESELQLYLSENYP